MFDQVDLQLTDDVKSWVVHPGDFYYKEDGYSSCLVISVDRVYSFHHDNCRDITSYVVDCTVLTALKVGCISHITVYRDSLEWATLLASRVQERAASRSRLCSLFSFVNT